MAVSKFDLNDRLLDFATVVAGIVKCIPGDLVGSHVAKQLVRAGTAPAAHHSEAQSAESRRDFIHKLTMALKELRETRTWLRFVARLHLVERPVDMVLDECEQLIAILAVSVRSASKRNTGPEG
jgi:four helix bundle protein